MSKIKFVTLEDVAKDIMESNEVTRNGYKISYNENQKKVFDNLGMLHKPKFTSFESFVYWCDKKGLSGTSMKEVVVVLRGRYEVSEGCYPKIEYVEQ